MVVDKMTFITSPMYPTSPAEKDQTYPPDLDCLWEFDGEKDTLIGVSSACFTPSTTSVVAVDESATQHL